MLRKAKSCDWRGMSSNGGGLTSPLVLNLTTPHGLEWLRCHLPTRSQVFVYSRHYDVVSSPFWLLPRCPLAWPRRPHLPTVARTVGSPHPGYCVTRHRPRRGWCAPGVQTNGGAGAPNPAGVALAVGVRSLAGYDPCGQLDGQLRAGSNWWACGGPPLFNSLPVSLWHWEQVILDGSIATSCHASCVFWRACGNGTGVFPVAYCCGRSE